MSSRNAYLSKFLLVKSLDEFPFKYGMMNTLHFTPEKGTQHYGSVNKQSHVIIDYRNIFETKYDELVYAIMKYATKGYVSPIRKVFESHKLIKIKSLTIQQIREIHDANMVLFAQLATDIAERQLIEEINKI